MNDNVTLDSPWASGPTPIFDVSDTLSFPDRLDQLKVKGRRHSEFMGQGSGLWVQGLWSLESLTWALPLEVAVLDDLWSSNLCPDIVSYLGSKLALLQSLHTIPKLPHLFKIKLGFSTACGTLGCFGYCTRRPRKPVGRCRDTAVVGKHCVDAEGTTAEALVTSPCSHRSDRISNTTSCEVFG